MWTLLLMFTIGSKITFDPYVNVTTLEECQKIGNAIKLGDPTINYRCVKNLDTPANP